MKIAKQIYIFSDCNQKTNILKELLQSLSTINHPIKIVSTDMTLEGENIHADLIIIFSHLSIVELLIKIQGTRKKTSAKILVILNSGTTSHSLSTEIIKSGANDVVNNLFSTSQLLRKTIQLTY